ncbi:DNA-binding protein [Fulvitalea axinellae]|uniref:DNA-binding protein n=1 Tax=Fulvitalea axinellae TaxID=1182444 RepID=A0AAU9CPN5_9BACT|nr:DNA-binding protein [Fulvitalea axinellae]
MPVKYRVLELANPRDRQAPKKFYAKAVKTGDVSLRDLSKEMIQQSTISSADAMAVLEMLTQLVTKHIQNGRIVRLGDLGNFRLNIKSRGEETEDKVSANSIIGQKVIFTPGSEFKDLLKLTKFEKVAGGVTEEA